MARDNVVFKFKIDLTQMTIKGREAIKILEDIQRKSGRAAQGMTQLGTASAKTGQQTAAAAINFQTATQGALNLSTAVVQTYTSISNLDRANNRAKMSVIAVARAEDLLANKIERQNTLRQQGLTGTQKDINITREIATAKADLTVKTEKMGIEQAAVNDIYMLFATNIANVTISSMQTIAILDKNQILMTKGKIIVTKLHSVAIRKQTLDYGISASAMGAHTMATNLGTLATIKATYASFGLAAALKTVTRSFAPLMIATVAISAAFLIYENNIGGVKDAIDNLFGVEKDHLAIMEEERNAALGLTAANEGLASSYKKLSTPMENYLKLQEVVAMQSGDLAAQIRITQQRMGFSQPTIQGGLQPTITGGIPQQGVSPSSVGGSLPSNVASALSPAGVAANTQIQSNVNPSVSSGVPVTTGASPTTVRADPFGSFLEKANFGALNVQDQALQLISLVDKSILGGDEFKAQSYSKWLAAISDDAVNYIKPKEGKHITFADIQNENTSFVSTKKVSDDPFARGNLIARSSPFIAKGVGKFKLGTDYNKIGTRTFYAGFGGEMIARIGQEYGAGMASNLVAELSRLQTEALGPDAFKKTRNNLPQQTQFEFDYMNKYGGPNTSSTAGLSQSAIAAGATWQDVGGIEGGAWRFAQRNAQTLANNRRRLDIRDANTNLLRFGGRLREGMTIEEEGAVVGGYSSPREFSAASRAAKYRGYDEGQRFAASFGIFANSSVMRGRSSRNSELGRVTSAAAQIRNALSTAGLGFKNIGYANNIRNLSPLGQFQSRRDRALAVTYNNNQYAKAIQINILEGGFGLSGFAGGSMDLPSLSDAVIAQDDLMKSIGLSRTEAFQIVDTKGRGREEIDDRVKWKSRLNSISTGTAVL
jgi:GTP cyclohydrolase II